MLNTLQLRINRHRVLSELRIKLLSLHKSLLDTERSAYEQVQGQVSRGEVLQLALDHGQFAWLHRLSKLIVQIDYLLRADEPVTSETVSVLLSDIRTLLTPDELGDDFALKYNAAFQCNPDVILAHADVVMLLPSLVQR